MRGALEATEKHHKTNCPALAIKKSSLVKKERDPPVLEAEMAHIEQDPTKHKMYA